MGWRRYARDVLDSMTSLSSRLLEGRESSVRSWGCSRHQCLRDRWDLGRTAAVRRLGGGRLRRPFDQSQLAVSDC